MLARRKANVVVGPAGADAEECELGSWAVSTQLELGCAEGRPREHLFCNVSANNPR